VAARSSAPAVRQRQGQRIESALESAASASDIAYFDNMLHHDPALRRKKRDFMRRVFGTAALHGVDAVPSSAATSCTAWTKTLSTSKAVLVVPLRRRRRREGDHRDSADAGLDAANNRHNNIAYTPAPGSRCITLCDKHASAIS
jgi:hypothetical protein